MMRIVIISLVVGLVLALVKTKRAHVICFLGMLLLGASILISSYLSEKPKIEQYGSRNITYSEILFDKDKKVITLKSDCCDYELTAKFIRASSTIDDVMNKLKSTSEVKVWYSVPETAGYPISVRGLEAQDLNIPLEVGMTLDDPSNYAFIGWLFLIIGGIGSIAAFFVDDAVLSDLINRH
jgi:hypothetical protein